MAKLLFTKKVDKLFGALAAEDLETIRNLIVKKLDLFYSKA